MIRASAASVLLVLLATAARAQPSPEAVLRAAELFDVGIERKRAGDLDGACAAFAESQALAPALGTQLNVAACLERAGELEAARALLRATAAEADAEGDTARAARARADLGALDERHLPASGPPPTPPPRPRPPPRAAPAVADPPRPAPRSRPTRVRLGLTLAATSLAAAGTAALLSAHGLQTAADAACPDPRDARCDRAGAQHRNDAAVARSRAGVGLLVTGAAFAAVATHLWWRDRREPRVQPGVAAAAGGALLTLGGAWP